LKDLSEIAAVVTRDLQELQGAGLLPLDGDFFPSVHYPPITMYPPITEEELFDGYEPPADGLFVVYVHIPFCRQYCSFCHYPNRLGDCDAEKDRYLAALEREMDITMARLGLSSIEARSVLIGGGTPTFLTPRQLGRFLDSFMARVDMGACTQFNWDVDPLTLIDSHGAERLRLLKAAGAGRLTIGVQSLDDGILRRMNRPHTAAEALQAVRCAKQEGFRLNIEFIFGYPGQSHEVWRRDIETACSLGVEEIQLYRLKTIPYGDHAGAIFRRAEPRVDAVTALVMKQAAIDLQAERGYHENLTRVFSLGPEHYSHYAHDQCCRLADQVSFGLTAFSSFRDRFGLNTQSFDEYYARLAEGRLPMNRGMVRGVDEQSRWHMVLPLKNRSVLKRSFHRATGALPGDAFPGRIADLKAFGLLEEDDDQLVLTPRGRFFADEVCHQFHSPRYVPFPKGAYAPGPLDPYRERL